MSILLIIMGAPVQCSLLRLEIIRLGIWRGDIDMGNRGRIITKWSKHSYTKDDLRRQKHSFTQVYLMIDKCLKAMPPQQPRLFRIARLNAINDSLPKDPIETRGLHYIKTPSPRMLNPRNIISTKEVIRRHQNRS